jgi:hypothetical protein
MVSVEMFGETGVMFGTMREGLRAGCAEGVYSPEIQILCKWIWDIGEFD